MNIKVLWSVLPATAIVVLLILLFYNPNINSTETKKSDTTEKTVKSESTKMSDKKVVKTDDEWRDLLTPEQYRITRECGTEPAFTGKYYKTKDPGTYICIACGAELFGSETKYESGSGWPSFYAPTDSAHVEEVSDTTLGMHRIEVKCSRCGAHLGHVFDDGPRPTGLRYCINSGALNFVPADSATDSTKEKKE